LQPRGGGAAWQQVARREEASRFLAAEAAEVAGMVTEALPELLDAKALRAELGVTRAAAEAIMRQLPVVQIPGLRKTYCRRSDVARLLEERTFEKTQVPA
jgi:hypothetical protein